MTNPVCCRSPFDNLWTLFLHNLKYLKIVWSPFSNFLILSQKQICNSYKLFMLHTFRTYFTHWSALKVHICTSDTILWFRTTLRAVFALWAYSISRMAWSAGAIIARRTLSCWLCQSCEITKGIQNFDNKSWIFRWKILQNNKPFVLLAYLCQRGWMVLKGRKWHSTIMKTMLPQFAWF